MNQKSLLAAVFVSTLALTSVACDDDSKSGGRDAGRDSGMDRAPDTVTTEAGADRTPDTTTAEVAADKAPDTTTPDAGIDHTPDTATDTPVDAAADMAVDGATDSAPDAVADLPPDTTPDVTSDSNSDVNPIALNGCLAYEDRTDPNADRGLNFVGSIAAEAERCMKVKTGTSVCFSSSSFATHPLIPFGGDTPNPIPSQSAGTAVCVGFLTPGVFGYKCNVHPTMTGAIWVIP
jgi:plastocyanin